MREDGRWKSEDKPGERPVPRSPALYMFESAADDGQPLLPRSTPTARRRGDRSCEEARTSRANRARGRTRHSLDADIGVTGEDDPSGTG